MTKKVTLLFNKFLILRCHTSRIENDTAKFRRGIWLKGRGQVKDEEILDGYPSKITYTGRNDLERGGDEVVGKEEKGRKWEKGLTDSSWARGQKYYGYCLT